VINSVSFKDGLRYYDNKQNYKKLRMLSDKLCKEYSLSVIENPKKKGWHYAEWQAEKEYHPTWRSTIRDDVDIAINNAMTYTQFIANLKKQGYEVKSHVKHIAVKIPTMDRFIRLRSLTRDNAYDEEHIKERILQNTIVKVESVQKPNVMKVKYIGNLKKARKLTGFRALYFHYLYHMGILPKNSAPKKRVHFLLKEDLRYMDQITKETTLICRHRINTIEDLDKQEQFVQERLNRLIKERRCVYNKIRRCKSIEKKALLQQDISSLSLEIREFRKEVVLYEGIRNRSVTIENKLHLIKDEQRKEREEIERIRRNR
ncbi:MAG: relaxase/mobilization nuclease domain-containing protein, partial [Longicatena sp.]